ncbi:MAG: hypothetical protein JKY37_23055 [Nannocystaceae bacterium]|nr:hypothetical protein [Nannocystaceae bacterium]
MISALTSLLIAVAPPVLPEPASSGQAAAPQPSQTGTQEPSAETTAPPEAVDADGQPLVPEQETLGPIPTAPDQTWVESDSSQAEPAVEPAVGPVAAGPQGALGPLLDTAAAGEETWKENLVRVQRPRYSGTGMFIAAGATFAAAGIVQAVDSLILGDASFGILERMFLATSMGMAAGGGIRRGHADAYDDTALRRKRPETRKILIAGAALVGVGATLGLVNEAMWWRCAIDETGPYSKGSVGEFQMFPCRYGLTRGLLDISAGATSAGLGMLTWALVYRRDARAFKGARVVGMSPTFGQGRAGFSVEGRF